MWEKKSTSVKIKYSLLAVNFMFLITGIITFSVGYSVHSAYNGYRTFLSDRFFSIPDFCVVTGVIVFLMAFFGFYGAYSGNYYVIKTFIWAIGLISVAHLSISIAGFMLQSQAVRLVQAQMEPTKHLYAEQDYKHMKQWDNVQEHFLCCGVNGAEDWAVYIGNTDHLPISCCGRPYGLIGTFYCNSRELYHMSGCAQKLGNWAAAQMSGMGLVGTVLALTQALLSIIAFWLVRIVRKPETNTAAFSEEIKKQVI